MRWKEIVLLLVLSAGTVLAADHGKQETGDATNRVKVIAKGAFSGIQEPKQIVITNATQWAEVWKQHNVKREPKPEPPTIDFSEKTVLFVTLGQKRTGGYGVEIDGIQQEEGKTVVTVKTRSPKPGGLQIQALTAPFTIVAIPRVEGKVQFKFE